MMVLAVLQASPLVAEFGTYCSLFLFGDSAVGNSPFLFAALRETGCPVVRALALETGET